MANTELTESIITDKTGRQMLKKLGDIVVSPQIVDNLTTDDPNRPLSARQGKYINDHVVFTTDNSVGSVLKSNADMLNGHPDTYFGTATDVQANADAISSISYNNLGAVIDLTPYTSDPYQTLTDGWLYLYAAGSSNQINVDVMGADDGSQYFILGLSSINYTTTTLYLRRGMRVKVTANTGSNNRIRFIPFVV